MNELERAKLRQDIDRELEIWSTRQAAMEETSRERFADIRRARQHLTICYLLILSWVSSNIVIGLQLVGHLIPYIAWGIQLILTPVIFWVLTKKKNKKRDC